MGSLDAPFDALILGGGFAGLSAAAALAEGGARVCVLEKKPHAGGRAYSFLDAETKQPIDNGQHLFMGCYTQTRKFLRRVGTEDKLALFKDVRVDFRDAEGRADALVCPAALGAPLHLAFGVLGLKGLTWGDKLGLLAFDRALRAVKGDGPLPAELDRLTVRRWLDSLGQSRRIQERLFDPIALGVLNDDPSVAAATGFVQALRRMFFVDVEGTRLGLSSVGLSELYTDAARELIERRGGRVVLSARAAELVEDKGRVLGVRLESGETLLAEETVSTLAPWDLKKVALPASLRGPWEDLKPAPIVSLSLWLDRPVVAEPLVGLLGTEIQWVFNKTAILGLPGPEQYLALVISGAHKHVGLDPKALLELAKRDLARCFPEFQKATIKRWKAVKEPFATLSPTPGSEAVRPEPGQGVPGFRWAGDWTRTGLPATIESAVVSGHKAAGAILGGRHAQVG